MLEFKPLADWQEQNTDHKSWVTSAGQCSSYNWDKQFPFKL